MAYETRASGLAWLWSSSLPAIGLGFLVRVPHSSPDQTPFNLCKVFLTCLGQFPASNFFFFFNFSFYSRPLMPQPSVEMGSHGTKTGSELTIAEGGSELLILLLRSVLGC